MSQHPMRKPLSSWVRKWFTPRRLRPIRRNPLLELEPLEPREMLAADFYNVLRDVPLDVSAARGVLANDSGSGLSTSLVDDVRYGSLALQPDGAFRYTPEAGFTGTDWFTYRNNPLGPPITVLLDVHPDNAWAWPDRFGVSHRGTLTADVMTNDADIGLRSLTAVLVSTVSHGTLAWNTNGTFTYTPADGYVGLDQFTYRLSDGILDSASAVVMLDVTNAAPLARDDAYSVGHDRTLTVAAADGVLVNDQDDDGEPLTASLLSDPVSGSLTFNADGSFTYVPNARFVGTDSFTYRLSDGFTTSDAATVTLTVTNDAPTAAGDGYRVGHDQALTVAAAEGVLVNDQDADGDPLTVTLSLAPVNGTVALNADGSFTYTPNAGFVGEDVFQYTASDGRLTSAPVTVTVRVENQAPAALHDFYETGLTGPLTVPTAQGVLANDLTEAGETLTAQLLTLPLSGTVTFNADGSFTYAPNAGFTGEDSFTYRAGDGLAWSAPATVTISVIDTVLVAEGEEYRGMHDRLLTVAAPGVLANDSGDPGETLTAVLGQTTANGTLTLNADGSFSYTPNAGFVGTDQFTYRASDGRNLSEPVTVTLRVTNTRPDAQDDAYFAPQNEILSVPGARGILANDTDDPGESLTITVIEGVANGTLTLNADGSFTYTPAAGYLGPDRFRYTVSDGAAVSRLATVAIEVTDQTVRGVADGYSANHDRTLTVAAGQGVLANDWHATGAALEAVLVSDVQHGTLSLAADGSFTYVPTAGYVGTDTFTYRAVAGADQSDPVQVTVEVFNNAPLSNGDSFRVLRGTVLNVSAPGVLANDADDEGETLTAILVSPPMTGTLTFNVDGSFTYTPAADFQGTTTFTYKARDGLADSEVTLVTLVVYNNAPESSNDNYYLHQGRTLTVPAERGVLTNDRDDPGQTLTASVVANPTNGTLTLNADGSFTYTPTAGFAGTDTFTYRASDGFTTGNTVTVFLEVGNEPPFALGEVYSVVHDRVLTVAAADGLLANDADADGDPLAVVLVLGVQHGTLNLNAADGSFTYTPAVGYVGTDTFTYKVGDGAATSNEVLVRIGVRNARPVAANDLYRVTHDRSLTVSSAHGLLRNDLDADGDPLQVVLVTSVAHGTLSLEADGSFTYTPTPGYAGPDSFQYYVRDGATASDTVTVQLEVINAPPQPRPDSYRTRHDRLLYVKAGKGLLSNDTDFDGDPLAITILSGPANGTLQLQAGGAFTYTPAAGFAGTDRFTYKVNDGAVDSPAVEVTIEVTNSVPVAGADFYQVSHDRTLTVAAAAGILANDSDADRDRLVPQLVSGVLHGSLTLNSDGSFTYTPAAGYVGTDRFIYRAADGVTTSSDVTVTLTVTNAAPLAGPRTYRLLHDTILEVGAADGLLAGVEDLDGDTLTLSVPAGVSNGTLTWNADGSFTYTPNAGFVGTDRFTYAVSDGAATTQAEVTIQVSNTAPVAVADSYSVVHDRTLTVAAPGVLANGRNWDGDTTTLSLITGPSNGTLSLNADGSFTYTPNAGFVGTDTFAYRLTDSVSQSGVATVTIQVTNDVPTSDPRLYQAHVNTTLSVGAASGLLAGVANPDGDSLSVAVVSGPASGTLNVTATTGAFTYAPNAGFLGTDSFIYRISDGVSESELITVTLAIRNNTPEVTADTYLVQPGTPLTVSAAAGVLTNDRDDAEDTLTATLVSGPGQGTLTLNADGSFTYTPNAGFTGTDSFAYRAGDGLASSDPVTVTLRVDGAATLAVEDAYLTRRNGTLTVAAGQGVAANDRGASGTVSLVTGPAHGTLALNADGSFTYTPNAGYAGADSFTYSIGGGSSTATVSLSVTNHAPLVAAEGYTVNTGSTLTRSTARGVLANDTDDDGDTLTASLATGPSHGTLTLNADGSFTYTPAAGFSGSDSFSYRVSDGAATSDPVTVSLSVPNPPPVAVFDFYRVHHDTPLVVAAPGVLGNDLREPGETLTLSLVSGPAHGTLTLNADGSFTYIPDFHYVGFDSFTYVANDGSGDSNAATVLLEVWNVAPRGTPNLYHVKHDTSLSVGAGRGVLANDVDTFGETLAATLMSGPMYGTLTFAADGSFTYTPAAGYVGSDGFTYSVSDGIVTTGPVSVAINVWNLVPGINPDSYRVHHGQTLTVSAGGGVLFNDYDDDGDPLTAQLVTGTAHGTLSFSADGSFSYTPNAGFVGTDSFTYRITDGVAMAGSATVTIVVENRVPVAQPDSYSVHHGTALSGQNVLANDWDGDNDPRTAILITSTSHGALTLGPDGTFTYVPNPGFVGSDSFTYKINDGAQDSLPATVRIEVWNNIPRGHDNYFEVLRGQVLSVAAPGVLWDDSDWDGDPVTAELVSGPVHGSLTLNADGSFTYTPSPNFSGTDSFRYRAKDPAQSSGPCTVTIDVLDNAPFAFDDTFLRHQTTGVITGNVASDDWDPEGDPLTVILVENVGVGTLSLSTNGWFTFTPPAPHWTGIVTFQYKLSDGARESHVALATIDVRNNAPLALADAFRTKHGTTLNKNVLANDYDADNDPLTVTLAPNGGPQHAASFTLNADGSFTYVPQSNFAGDDYFTYQVSDGAATATATVTIKVENTNPVGRMDFFPVPKRGSVAVTAAQLLANDHDFDGDPMTVRIVSQPRYGTLTGGDGNWTYTPSFLGRTLAFDQFTYVANDGLADSEPVLVVFTLQDDGYAAYSDEYRALRNTTLTVAAGQGVLANDWTTRPGGLTATQTTDPTHGSLTFNADGSFSYTPNPDFLGTDSFSYKITEEESATVTIQVVAVVPQDDTFTMKHDRRLTGDVLDNDLGTPGEPLRALLQSGPSHGTLDLIADGSFLYMPNAGWVGTDTFTYKVTNGIETSASAATVTIHVTNQAPIGAADNYSTPGQTPLVIRMDGVLGNDTDADGDPLKVTVVSGPSGSAGTLALNDDGSFIFIPTDTFAGTTSFTYKASDGIADTGPMTVTIQVTNSPPTAVDQSYSVYHGQTLEVGLGRGLLSGATDELKHALTAVLVSGPAHGNLTFNADGSFRYTPASNFVGTDGFTYKVRDVHGAESAVRTATIHVQNTLAVGPWRAISLDEFYGTMNGGGYGYGYGGPISGDVLDVAYDYDGDPITAFLISTSLSGGSLTFNPNGTFNYSGGYGGSFLFGIRDGFNQSGPYQVSLIYRSLGTSNDLVLSPGESFTCGRMTVYNAGPGTVQILSYSSSSATVGPVSGTDFSVSIQNGHGTWSGNVSGTLTFSAEGDVSAITIDGDLNVSAGGNIGHLSGRNVTASGDNVGNVSASQDAWVTAFAYGGYGYGYGGLHWNSVSGLGVVGTVNAGRDVTSVSGASLGAITAGRNVGMVRAYDVGSSITAGGGITEVRAVRNLTGTVAANGGDIGDFTSGSGGLYAGHNLSGQISATGRVRNVEARNSIFGAGITAGSDINRVHAGRNLSAPVNAGRDLLRVQADDHISSALTAARDIVSLSAGYDFTGSASANGGNIGDAYGGYAYGSVYVGRDLSGSLSAANNVGSVSVGHIFSGSVTATNGQVQSVNAWEFTSAASVHAGTSIGSVSATRTVAGTITASGGGISSITAGSGWSVQTTTISATGTIGMISAGRDVSGSITTTAGGNLTTLTAGETISARVTVSGSISTVDADRDITGSITAGGSLGTVDANRDITGHLTATSGGLTYAYAGRDFTGGVSVGAGITQGVAAGRHYTGNITAGADIASVRAGYLRKYLSPGVTFELRGGNLSGSTIEAGSSIGSVDVGRLFGDSGNIANATLRAQNGGITSITAGAGINATIFGQTSIGSVAAGSAGGAGNIAGSIEARTQTIGSVTANFGSISASIKAGTSIDTVTATHDITGPVTAGTRIGDLAYRVGVHAMTGDVTGPVKAGSDVGSVQAGRHVASVEAGGTIGEVVAGALGGGNITGRVTAGGDINRLAALGPWAESARRSVYNSQSLPVGIEWLPGQGKPTHNRRPRPGAIPLATGGGYGNIQGEVTANTISSVTAFGNIQDNVTARGSLGPVWALGSISGDLRSGQGGLTADAWKDISGQVWGQGDLTLRSWGTISGSVVSTAGGADVTAWTSVTGRVIARNDALVWAYDTAAGDVTSQRGKVNVGAMKEVTGKIKSVLQATVVGAKIASGQIVSAVGDIVSFAFESFAVPDYLMFFGKTWVVSMGNVTVGPVFGAGLFAGNVSIVGWGNVHVMDVFRAAKVEILAEGNVSVGRSSANESIHIEGQNVSGNIGTGSKTPKSVTIKATGDLGATVQAKKAIDVQVFGKLTGSLTATHDPEAYIGAAIASDVTGRLNASGGIGLKTWGNLTGSVATDGGLDLTVGGRASGALTAGGYVELVAWQTVTSTITTTQGYVDLMTAGHFAGTVNAAGDANLEVWGDLQGTVNAGVGSAAAAEGHQPTAALTVHGNATGSVTSSHHVSLDVFGRLQSRVTATAGNADVNAYETISGAVVRAGGNASVSSWKDVSGLTVTTTTGDAFVWSQQSGQSISVTAGGGATVSSPAHLTATVTARNGDAEVSALGDVRSGTTLSALNGSVRVFAGGNADIQATAGLGTATPQRPRGASVAAFGTITGQVTARDQVSITGLDAVNVQARSHAGGVDVFADGQLQGSYTGYQSVSAVTLGSGATQTQGTYQSTIGDVRLISLVGFNGTVDAGANAEVTADGNIAGTVTARAAAQVLAGNGVSATVTAGTDAEVSAIDGNVSGAVTAERGSASVLASGNVTAPVKGYQNVSVLAQGDVTARLDATRGDAEVITFGSLSAPVAAGQDAFVFADGPVSASVGAGRDATVTSTADVSGSVTAGRDAHVLALGQVTGSVTAQNDAAVTALGQVTGSVTATHGSASVVAGGNLTGSVTAGRHADLWTAGNLQGTVGAGQDVSVVVWGSTQAPLTAGRDLSVFSFGPLSANVTAGRDATVTAFADAGGTVTAGGDARVVVLANLTGPVTAGGLASAFALGQASGAVTSTAGSVELTAVGDLTSPVQAAQNATLVGFGLVSTTVTATSGAADVLGLGASVQVQVSAGQGVQIRSLGDLTATVTAGGDADLLALGALTATVTAANNASVLAGGPVTATVTATSGDALAFATGTLTGSLTAGRDATAATLQTLQTNVTAGGEATVLALGAITGVTISGQAEAFVWSYGSLSSVQVSSSQGDATAITNGPASGVTVSAGTEALLASVGGMVTGSTVMAGGRAGVLGLGVTSLQANAGGDLNVLSCGVLDLSFTAGRDALLQTSGALTATGTAGRDLRLYTYGTLGGTLTAGDDVIAVALGSITASLQAADNVDLVVTYDALLGSVIAGTAGNPAGDADPADGYGHIRRVYVWNDLDGTLTAFDTLGEVYVGGTLGPDASLNAPHIGLVAEHDRSPFVEDPMPVVVRLGEVVALTRDAYRQLLDLAHDFQAARTEALAVATATTADMHAVVQQAIEQLLRLRAEGQNTLTDISVQVQLARAEAEAMLGQALDAARVALEAARREAQDAAGHARDELYQERAALLGEATARLKDALDDRDFTISEAVQLAGRIAMLRNNQLAQGAWMQTAHSATFVATFIEKLAEYAVDKVQDELQKIGLVAQFIPGVGWIIGAVANGLNAAIYAARGKYGEAGFSVFEMIPFGSILRKTGAASAASKLGSLALRQAGRGLVAVAKFVPLPALGRASQRLACKVLTKITLGKLGSFCFVDGTPVVIGEEWVAVTVPVADELAQLVPATPPAEEDATEWDRLSLVLLVGTLVLTLGGWLLLERRRRLDEQLTAADEVWLDTEDWLGRKDPDADWEAMLAELARGRLGLRESGVGA